MRLLIPYLYSFKNSYISNAIQCGIIANHFTYFATAIKAKSTFIPVLALVSIKATLYS